MLEGGLAEACVTARDAEKRLTARNNRTLQSVQSGKPMNIQAHVALCDNLIIAQIEISLGYNVCRRRERSYGSAHRGSASQPKIHCAMARTVRSTPVAGNHTRSLQPVHSAQTDPPFRLQHPIPDPNDFPTCQVVSVRAPAATDGRPAPSACCLARSKAVTVPNAYQAHTQPSHLFRRPPPLGSFGDTICTTSIPILSTQLPIRSADRSRCERVSVRRCARGCD